MDKSWRILISGSTGLIGSALVSHLRGGGHRVSRLVRPGSPSREDAITWDSLNGGSESSDLEGFDAVVHLAGENLARRWTPSHKDRILNSRVQTTRLLCETLQGLNRPPRVLVSASAIGYYGDRGDNLLTESDSAGTGFVCDVVRAWEDATSPARENGIRVVNARFGIVLCPKGGSLHELLPFFRFGLGGPIAGGQYYWSWITIRDVVAAIQHALFTELLSGPVNVVSPNPVRQQDFCRVLGSVLHRPSRVNVPHWALRLRLGREFADFLLWSERVVPDKLMQSGYAFLDPDLHSGLGHLLERRYP
jgi:uncharacterized protein (TIGR01777 family)